MVGKPGEIVTVEAKIVKVKRKRATVIYIDGERYVLAPK